MTEWLPKATKWIVDTASSLTNGLITWIDKLWDALGKKFAGNAFLRDAALAAAVVLYLAINVARNSLDAGIRKIHPAGVPGVSANTLHDGSAAIRKAFETWAGGYERLRTLLGHRPVTLAIAQTVLELILALLSFFVYYGVVKAIRKRVKMSSPIHTLLQFSAIGVVVYVVLGVLDQLAELAILGREGTIAVLDSALHVSGVSRTYMLPLILLPVIIGLIQIERDKLPKDRWLWWRGSGTTYRVLIVVVLLHAVLLLFSIPGAQSADAMRLWMQTPSLAVTGLVFTSILSLSLTTIALRLGTDANPKRVVLGRTGTVRLAIVGAILIVVGLVARGGPLGLHRQAVGAGLLSAGVLVFVVAVLSFPLAPQSAAAADEAVGNETSKQPAPAGPIVEPTAASKRLAPAIFAIAPLTALALSLIRASIPSIMDSRSSGWLIQYAAAAMALAVIGFCLARAVTPWAFRGTKNEAARKQVFLAIEITLALICLVVYWLAIRDPWQWGPRLGVAAIIAIFLTSLVVVFGTLGHVMESQKLPAALDFVGFRRLPVIIGLIALALLSHRFTEAGYHDLRTMPDEALPAAPQITLETAFQRWIAANLDASTETGTPAESRPAVPMVFVAAAGGGIKAAAFTSAAIDCIFVGAAGTQPSSEPAAAPAHPCTTTGAWQRLFVASGASGGSVGIASVLAERQAGEVADGWISDRLGEDLLSPELAWQLFVEVPNAIASLDPSRDRAEVLQESWRRQFQDGGADPAGLAFYTDTTSATWTDPVVFFSGTNLNDGCRVNISAARSAKRTTAGEQRGDRADPPVIDPGATRRGACKDQRAIEGRVAPDQSGTRDLVDYLCGGNIDLATAAFLSARFPAVSPTGTIRCRDDDIETGDSLSIGDGGYRDNSGAASIMDTWGVLEPLVADYNLQHDHCIVPIFVEINNGYAGFSGPSASSDVAQLIAPALGAAKVFSDLSYGPVEQAAAEFTRPLSGDLDVLNGGDIVSTRFFRVSLVDHPGVTAPLGWSLSSVAVDDLVGQLDLQENNAALVQLREILEPTTTGAGLTCNTR